MPGQVGMLEIAVVLIIALLVLGPQRLPVVARNLGRGVREFKEAISFDRHDDDDDVDELPRSRELEADREETRTGA